MSTPERFPSAGTGWRESAGGAASAVVDGMTQALRLLRAGLCFLYFGLGVWFVGAVVLPLLRRTRWRGLPPEELSLRAQRVVHLFCRSFVVCITRLMCVARVQWAGEAALARGPVLVVANHPSLLDTPLLLSQLPQADFIVNPEWRRLAWLRGTVEGAGYLHSESGAEVVRDAVARLRAGRSVVVYPEGSRTPPEGLRPFQRGAAHIALEAGCEILPVIIQVMPRALMRGERWTAYPRENPLWRVVVGEPIRPSAAEGSEPRALAARRLTGVLQEHFEKRWRRGGN